MAIKLAKFKQLNSFDKKHRIKDDLNISDCNPRYTANGNISTTYGNENRIYSRIKYVNAMQSQLYRSVDM